MEFGEPGKVKKDLRVENNQFNPDMKSTLRIDPYPH